MNSKPLKKAIGRMAAVILLMVLLPAVLSFTAEYPEPVTKHYLSQEKVYWKIEQITISPIFDEPETSIVDLYFQKPDELYLVADDRQIIARGDTIWTYLIKHKQIQKVIGGGVFNPFDFIDTSNTFYDIVKSDDNVLVLKSQDSMTEPDSLQITFSNSGIIENVIYPDVNENEVKLRFLTESFTTPIPEDNFLAKVPEGVEVIDISDQ